MKYGLINGRHPMPVTEYIVNEEVNPIDIETIDNIVWSWCAEHQNMDIEVIVTGLTAVTASLIVACEYFRIGLTLLHYNRETGAYVKQPIWIWKTCAFCGYRYHPHARFCEKCGAE